MADAVLDTKETPVVEKDAVTSPVKECPIKETNGSSKKAEESAENGTEENGTKNGTAKENGSSDEDIPEEPKDEEDALKENGDSDVCAIKRKSCSGDAENPEATTPEKKQKLAEEESEETVEA